MVSEAFTLDYWIRVLPEIFIALSTGGDFEWIPDAETEGATYFCSDGEWYAETEVMGVCVENGEPFLMFYALAEDPTDGCVSFDMRDPALMVEAEDYYNAGRLEQRNSLRAYYTFVRDTATDPMHEFLGVRPTRIEQQTWAITFRKVNDIPSLNGTVMCMWRQLSGNHVFEEQVFPPDEVARYGDMCLRDDGTHLMWTTRIAWVQLEKYLARPPKDGDGWSQWNFATEQLDPTCITVTTKLKMEYPNDSYIDELRAAATNALRGV